MAENGDQQEEFTYTDPAEQDNFGEDGLGADGDDPSAAGDGTEGTEAAVGDESAVEDPVWF